MTFRLVLPKTGELFSLVRAKGAASGNCPAYLFWFSLLFLPAFYCSLDLELRKYGFFTASVLTISLGSALRSYWFGAASCDCSLTFSCAQDLVPKERKK